MLAEPFGNTWIDVVAAPAVGGIILAGFTAAALDRPNDQPWEKAKAVWADKQGDGFGFERAGFRDVLEESEVLVVEDLLTTGGSVKKVCDQIAYCGGNVSGVSVIVNRGGITAEQLGVPRLESLAQVSFSAVDEAECELCVNHVPIVEDIGHGGEFKQEHPNYEGGYIKLLS
jgi:orotate phosphoribosyltransferase